MKLRIYLKFVLLSICYAPRITSAQVSGEPHSFALGSNSFVLDGKQFQMRSGEIHAARVPKEYWRHRLEMCKAMGLNTVCEYLFWNLHEPKPSEFVWTGQADDAEFCRIAQEEGLWVVLRPVPYACGEWEMGGLPWWLLKNNVQLRSSDRGFIEPLHAYLKEVGRELGPLQITHGGPIIMAQVENEYGFYGHDKEYIDQIRKSLLAAGFDVPLFECNPPDLVTNGMLTNVLQAVNFGSMPQSNFGKLRNVQPRGPLFCSEFYTGWFDTWGVSHHLNKTDTYLRDLEYMLTRGESFNLYMAHGGTSFGLWAGCNRPMRPDVSSYDYNAPISEAGWATPKFSELRGLFAKHLLPGETLPDLPPQNPVVTFAPVELKERAPIFGNLPAPIQDEQPRNMEAYDQGYGCILYRTKVSPGPAAALEVAGIHDFGFVFVGDQRIGILDRRSGTTAVMLPERRKEAQLDVLVEPMGRINFGLEISDRKGLFAPVKLGDETLNGWNVFRLPLDDAMLAGLKYKAAKAEIKGPAFWRGTFTLEKPGDTFLDLRSWGKGDLWVNGHCLGRYWNIGPTQTAYAPGCWLHPGKNQVVILDLLGPQKPQIAGLATPILDELHSENDFLIVKRPVTRTIPVASSPTAPGSSSPGR